MKTIQNGRARSGFWAVVTGLCLWLAGGVALAGNTCTWTGSWDVPPANTDDVIVVASGGNLTWSSSMPSNVASWTQQATYTNTATFQTVYGATGFTNFTVSGDVALLGGAWTHVTNVTVEANRLRVSVGGNLLVSNATITADFCGYNKGGGSGGGGAINQEGAAYGGAGGNTGNQADNLKTYGSVISPTNLGSAGGSSSYLFPGGGAIWLSVAGTTTVASAGILSANGYGSTSDGRGAGAGGSIYLVTGWLKGNGTIQANGGGNNTGPGGGGRVALILTGTEADFTTSWTGTNTAYGGLNNSGGRAAAGTVYLRTTAGVDTLIIDNNNQNYYGRQVSTLMPPGVNLNAISNVVIRKQGILGIRGDTTVDFGTFAPAVYGSANSGISIDGDTNVTYPANWNIDNYTLAEQGVSKTLGNVTIGTNGVMTHYKNYGSEAYKLNLNFSGNLTILSNGTITADSIGFYTPTGPGGSSAAPNGASYGGMGYGNGKTYGSILAPTNLGSVCQDQNNYYYPAGGAIILTVAGTTTVSSAASVTAIGMDGSYGCGSGGSIYLRTGWLTGGGSIRANGGKLLRSDGNGASGGGRVSIILTNTNAKFDTWTGTTTAYAGTWQYTAAAGTVYCQAGTQAAGAGTIIVDNGTTATNSTYTPLPAFSNSTENIGLTAWVSTNNARIGLVTNTAVLSLTLNANGFLELNGHTLTVKTLIVTNKVYHSGFYGPSFTPLSALTDSGSGGKVVVPPKGTVFCFR